MKESDLRKWHRGIGIILALFILLQAGSGFLISLSGLSTPPHSHAHTEAAIPPTSHTRGTSVWNNFLRSVHHGGDAVGSIYRILVGIGTVGMAVSGSGIFFKSRGRLQKGLQQLKN